MAQLTKLSGRPSNTDTMMKAKSMRESMTSIMKRPMFACAQKNGMLSRQYNAAIEVCKASAVTDSVANVLLTTTSVSMISLGGSMLALTIRLTKYAVIPTIEVNATSERRRKSRKVLAKGVAPYDGMAILCVWMVDTMLQRTKWLRSERVVWKQRRFSNGLVVNSWR